MPQIPLIDPTAPLLKAKTAEVLLRRNTPTAWVLHLDSGRVALGLLDDDKLEHQFGVVEGPSWLDATAAVLQLPSLVDAVAQTDVSLRRVPLAEFRRTLADLPDSAQEVLRDVALAHRQQTELAVSRLSKDAESRCAEWLVRHAEPGPQGGLIVSLQQRKRLIAAQLGIAPETLSRVLHQLRERGLVAGVGRILTLPQPDSLRALAGA
jgi:CRP-like cAMP-binding protein